MLWDLDRHDHRAGITASDFFSAGVVPETHSFADLESQNGKISSSRFPFILLDKKILI
jgi:hypothetical protein